MTEQKQDLVNRLRAKASSRRSVQVGGPVYLGDPVADLLEEAACKIVKLENDIHDLKMLLLYHRDHYL